jgi:hypothetical protein
MLAQLGKNASPRAKCSPASVCRMKTAQGCARLKISRRVDAKGISYCVDAIAVKTVDWCCGNNARAFWNLDAPRS